LRERAIEAVKWAVRYKPLAGVRVLGIEIMQRHFGERGLPWIRNALLDENDGVKFAALLALGAQRDRDSVATIRAFVNDENGNLRAAAIFALHQMGDTRHSARLPELLLDAPEADVRRSAALVLGLLGEKDAVKLLARLMKDESMLVRQQALESMALLGNREAIQQLTFEASSGTGENRVPAIAALTELADPSLENTFRYKLASGEYIETRLAAARGLGVLNSKAGLEIALRGLDFDSPLQTSVRDPAREQIRRVRQLAALALGAIGDRRALPALAQRMNDQSDPRVQIVAADAILQILGMDALASTVHAANH
jgi:HEAT repeat protein